MPKQTRVVPLTRQEVFSEVLLEEAVERGVKVLDAVRPGWYAESRLNPGRLDLWHHRGCVLGQLYGRYGRGIDVLKDRKGKKFNPIDHGFSIGVPRDHPAWKVLTAIWQRVILTRRVDGPFRPYVRAETPPDRPGDRVLVLDEAAASALRNKFSCPRLAE